MKVIILESVKEVNDYLKLKKPADIIKVSHKFQATRLIKDNNGREAWELLDRFMILEK